MRRIALASAAVLAAILMSSAPAMAAESWHEVHEPWESVTEPDVTRAPAARYCGDFDLETRTLQQGVRGRVLSRWENGNVREQEYLGPYIVEAVNVETGASKQYNISGHATYTFSETGALQTVDGDGPFALGWPVGSAPDLPNGYYYVTGRHIVSFADTGVRSMLLDQGREENMCDAVR
jgi:hypothetical protein